MNGFLVLLVQAFDDVPIRLCEHYKDAITVAKAQRINGKAPKCWPCDAGSPVRVAVIEFIDGKPIEYEVVKTFGK